MHNSISMTTKCQKQHDRVLRVWGYAAKTAGLALLYVVAWWTIGMFGWLFCCWNVDYRHIPCCRIRFLGGAAAACSSCLRRFSLAWTIGMFSRGLSTYFGKTLKSEVDYRHIRGGLSACGKWTIGMVSVDYPHATCPSSRCDAWAQRGSHIVI